MRPASHPPAGPWSVVAHAQATPHGRWTMAIALPPAPLDRWVECIWASRGEGVFTREDILPRTPTEVLFALGDTHWLRHPADAAKDRAYTRAFVSGLHLAPLAVESPPDSEMAGIRLHPSGAAAFLRDSPATIAGAVIDLDALLGAGVESLREQVASVHDLRHRVQRLAAAVERHLAAVPELPATLAIALDSLRRSAGRVPIRRLVADSGWSHRHFSRRFREEIGVAPKTFARIARFASAFARLQSMARVHWAEFALDCGYFDQAHLIHDFVELAGTTPTEVFRRRAPDGLGLLDEDEVARRG